MAKLFDKKNLRANRILATAKGCKKRTLTKKKEVRKMTKEKKQSSIIQAIKKEVEIEHDKHVSRNLNITSDCSEANCSNYCSDHHDTDH